ncbi:hypothetical protein SK128_004250, partial [Halocaridina rubra]
MEPYESKQIPRDTQRPLRVTMNSHGPKLAPTNPYRSLMTPKYPTDCHGSSHTHTMYPGLLLKLVPSPTLLNYSK